MTDPIADMLTRIRNGSQALLADVEVSHSRMKESVAQILKREGYIADWSVDGKVALKKLKLVLMNQGRRGVIAGLRRISTPGLRRYARATPKGVMTGLEAQKNNLGGEVVCYVW